MKKIYEVMYIIDKTATNIAEVQEKMNLILKADGGKIIEESNWGMMNFAYPIDKKDKGTYIVAIVETKSENIDEFQRISRIDKNIVRTLIVNTEKEKNYIQSTKLSKTDMSKLIDENKRNFERRPFDKNRRFYNKDQKPEERKPFDNKFVEKEKTEENSVAKTETNISESKSADKK
ncbi:30S ribosomal protein S6 [Spiroplasma endosymbiont of Crioceris asparagi]|uniref:30S ribosomal protein S6 n=1 Tax=Spiroplasma endosymbiont of Crioceris asparagi TaxID=3066286 RepID=UPI0030D60972